MKQRFTRAEYREYIESLAELAERDPKGYQRRVILLVLKGYGFIVGLLLLVLLAIAALVALAIATERVSVAVLKLGIPLVVLAVVFARSLWVRLPAPGGTAVEASEAPELHAMIERVRVRLGAPRPHAILRTADFNASVTQIPRFGLFGGYRSYVVLGVPLLEALTPIEFEAVVAHEFGHLAGEHGRFGAWIYQMRVSWGRVLAEMEASDSGMNLMKWFLKGFLPEFDATTFVMARRHEYEADRAAAEATDPRAIGSALVRLELMGRARTDRFGGLLAERLTREATPPEDMLGEQIRILRAGLEPETARAWLREALAQPTDLEHTHPSLADRLAALGVDPESLPAANPVERSASEVLVGPAREAWRQEISGRLHAASLARWREEHAEKARALEAHREWKARAAAGSLAKEDRFDYAVSLHAHEGPEAALAHLRASVAAEPGDHRVRRMLGELLLDRDDEAGLDEIAAVAAVEPALAAEACARAYRWLFRRGRTEEADEWFERLRRCNEAIEQGQIERNTVSPADEFLPHGLPEEAVREIRGAALALRGVRNVWLVRKRLSVLPEEPLWILFLGPMWNRISFGRDKREEKILIQVSETVPAPAPSLYVVLTPALAPLRAKLEAIDSARLR